MMDPLIKPKRVLKRNVKEINRKIGEIKLLIGLRLLIAIKIPWIARITNKISENNNETPAMFRYPVIGESKVKNGIVINAILGLDKIKK